MYTAHNVIIWLNIIFILFCIYIILIVYNKNRKFKRVMSMDKDLCARFIHAINKGNIVRAQDLHTIIIDNIKQL